MKFEFVVGDVRQLVSAHGMPHVNDYLVVTFTGQEPSRYRVTAVTWYAKAMSDPYDLLHVSIPMVEAVAAPIDV